MLFEATRFVIEQREEESLSGSLSETWRELARGPESIPFFCLYYNIVTYRQIVLVDCHECYGRKILEWSMHIKDTIPGFHRGSLIEKERRMEERKKEREKQSPC